MLPVFCEDILGDATLFPWLVSTTAFGAMLGALATGRDARPTLDRSALRLCFYGLAFGVFASSALVAAPLGGAALRAAFVVAFVSQFVVGYFYFAVMTSLQTLIQQLVDDASRGRVMSLFQVAWGGLTPVGALGMGALATVVGIEITLQVSAVACVVSGALIRRHALRPPHD